MSVSEKIELVVKLTEQGLKIKDALEIVISLEDVKECAAK